MSEETIDELAAEAGITDNEQRLAMSPALTLFTSTASAVLPSLTLLFRSVCTARSLRKQNDLIAKEEANQEKAEKAKDTQDASKETSSGQPSKQSASTSSPSSTPSTSDSSPTSDGDAKAADDDSEVAELGSLAESLLSMTQRSAVEEERKRLQKLLGKMEEGKRRRQEKELVRQARPDLPDRPDGKDGEHPIQTLDDLARWQVDRIQEAEARKKTEATETKPLSDVAQPSPATASSQESEKEEKKREVDEEEEESEGESARDKLSSQLESMLSKLRERIVDVDTEIGERLHLLQPRDPSGRVDDEELTEAMQRLQRVDPKQVKKLIGRIKGLARERRKRQLNEEDGEGENGKREGERSETRMLKLTDEEEMELSVDDLIALAEEVKEESEASSGRNDGDDRKEDSEDKMKSPRS